MLYLFDMPIFGLPSDLRPSSLVPHLQRYIWIQQWLASPPTSIPLRPIASPPPGEASRVWSAQAQYQRVWSSLSNCRRNEPFPYFFTCITNNVPQDRAHISCRWHDCRDAVFSFFVGICHGFGMNPEDSLTNRG